MTEPLTAADRGALAAERGPVNMAIAGVVVLEASPTLTYEALCRRLAARIHNVPRYRQRIEQPALGLAAPAWTDDEDFDISWHVRLARLPEPGGEAELAAYVAREAARVMDRSRPLWELHLVEGLAGGRVAVIPKMHHALVDGLAAIGIGMILLDVSPDAGPDAEPAPGWSAEPYDPLRHMARLATAPIGRGLRLAVDSAERLLDTSPRSLARDARRATSLVADLATSRPTAPALPLNHRISANRSFAMAQFPLDAIKAAGREAGATVNDVVLAAVTGMLDGWLRDAGVRPKGLRRDPVALVPVSLREAPGEPAGNRFSIVFVDLPVREANPRRRVELIHERMEAIKASTKVRAGALMLGLAGMTPPLLSSMLARAGGGASRFNLVVSNVPGPQFPLYLCGARVLEVYPAVPLNPADQGLNAGVFSYDGRVCFGLMADRALEPPVEVAREALVRALTELTAG